MSSQNSYKKIEAVKGITTKGVAFITGLQDATNSLHNAANNIAVPVFDRIYTGFAQVGVQADELLKTTGTEMAKLCDTWGQRSGFGEKAVVAFEEAKTSTQALHAVDFVATTIEEHDGMHENVSPDTIGAFTNALTEYLAVKDTFIYGIASEAEENTTDDTQEIFNTIGGGMERFTNSIVDVLEANKADIARFGINLDEAIDSAKKTATNIAEAGAEAVKKAPTSSAL